MILAASLFGASESATVNVPKKIIESLPEYPCSEPHIDFQEEGVYLYCDQGYIYRMAFYPEDQEACYVSLIGDHNQVYGVSTDCNDEKQFDNYESQAVQNFFEHFGITVTEERKKRRH